MATIAAPTSDQPLVSIKEYLRTSYRPDCDYIDDHLEARDVGEYDHGYLQLLLGTIFTINREAWAVRAVTDVRTQVSPTRFRCPDISVMRAGSPKERIITHPALIAIEIFSPEERLTRTQDRINDYLTFGIEHIWILDPERRTAHVATKTGLHLVQSGELTVPETPIRIVLSELFAELDQA